MISAKLALREILNNRTFAAFFITNLSVGFVGLFLVEIMRSSLETSLESRSRMIAGADLSVESRRPITSGEIETINRILPNGSDSAEVTDFFTMVGAGRTTKLAQCRAVEEMYPFYGEMTLAVRGPIGPGQLLDKVDPPVVWMDGNLARELDLKPGDSFQLGATTARIADLVVTDSTQGFASLGWAPRIYIPTTFLPVTGLVRPGSVRTHRILVRLPADQDEKSVSKALKTAFADRDLRIRTHQESSRRTGRLFERFSDFLGLVSLTALLLAAFGASYQFRRFLLQRRRPLAILLSLGASPQLASRFFFIKLLILSTASAAIAWVAASAVLPLGYPLVEPLLPAQINLKPEWTALWAGSLAGISFSIALCWPSLKRLRSLRPAILFRDVDETANRRTASHATAWLPAALLFVTLSVWLSRSWKVGLSFVGIITLTFLASGFFTRMLFRLLRAFSPRLPVLLRVAARQMVRRPDSSLLTSATLSVATLLFALVPQVRFNLQEDVLPSIHETRPSLFLFDIQDEQLAPIQEMARREGIEMADASPMVMARLLSVNGMAPSTDPNEAGWESREDERRNTFRNWTFRLTYRDQLGPSEEIVKGKPFTEASSVSGRELAQISVEQRFAHRRNWELGDVLVFDVLGVRVRGEIVNLRKVRWTSFQPNFFVQFQSGVLDDSPKTWIATVPQEASMRQVQFLQSLNRSFPNVSAVRVDAVVDRVMDLLSQMGGALLGMALWCSVAGLLTLLMIHRFEAYAQRWASNLLKVLGARRIQVLAVMALQSVTVSTLAAMAGAGASLLASYWLMKFVFYTTWKPDWLSTFLVAGAAITASLFMVLLAGFRDWTQAPQSVLRESG